MPEIMTQDEIEKIRTSKKDDPNINLYILLHQTDILISNAVDIELKHLKVTQSQVSVLTKLSREDRPVTLDELTDWCLKDFSSVFTLVNRMEKKGLIKKIKKNGDAKTYVALTKKGNILYHQKITERSIRLIIQKLSDDEKKQLKELLKKLRDYTRDVLGLDFRPEFLP
jgi:DNA-binding MarR family transcriptional regulator